MQMHNQVQSPYFTHVTCLECGHQMPNDRMATTCPACASHWLDAHYDYAAVAQRWASAETFLHRPRSLWRYHELLPLPHPDPEISMGEGFTSLIRLYQYERLFNHPHIYIKDERQGPTSSFKDRQAALSVTAMRQAGIKECVLASTGNAAAAYAAYCARAGIKLWLFLTSLVPAEKMREAALYGAEVIKVSGTYDETKDIAAEFARRKGIYLDKGAKAIPGKESMKTMGYEIAEQFAAIQSENGPPAQPFKSPDWYVQAVSGGIGPLGVWKGFSELFQMGLIDKMPRLAIIQVAGCAPMVEAFNRGDERATPVIPNTLITVLATGDPGYSYVQLREAVLSNNGVMTAIDDGATFAAMRKLASTAGFSVEPATAVAFAGLEKLLTQGVIAEGESVVVNCSGHTFPAESHILGDQYVMNLDVSQQDDKHPERIENGLGAALAHLDEQVTTILIVDDMLNDRRLIRRLLQRYKSYRVLEAQSGEEALKIVATRKPDLIVADLTMPEMDGFTLLERLKSDPETAHIPVVVVSAKTLTAKDRRFLDEYSNSVWTKGGFDTRQLVDHVVRTLGDETINESASLAGGSAAPLPDRGDQYKLLVIEDTPEHMRLIRRYLESSGQYRIYEAETGREGLKSVYEHRPDLILLDLMLPDMDGRVVLESLANHPEFSDIPVVILSAKELSSDELQRMQKQIYRILGKNTLNRSLLLNIIKDILI